MILFSVHPFIMWQLQDHMTERQNINDESFPANFVTVCGQADERDLNNVPCWGTGCRGSLTWSEQFPHVQLRGQHTGYCDPHTAPGPAMRKEGHNQDRGISWAWNDRPFKPKGRGKMEIIRGKLDNDTRVVYRGKGYGRCWVAVGRKWGNRENIPLWWRLC